ncbi:MAG TPA: acyl carrier protein [Pseudomonadales bacterium]
MQGQLADIEAEIKNILRSFLKDPPPLSGATDLIADLDLESVQVMEFVMQVEDHYDIAIDLESLSNVHTIGELAAVVAANLE